MEDSVIAHFLKTRGHVFTYVPAIATTEIHVSDAAKANIRPVGIRSSPDAPLDRQVQIGLRMMAYAILRSPRSRYVRVGRRASDGCGPAQVVWAHREVSEHRKHISAMPSR
jgi:hypothetical protein